MNGPPPVIYSHLKYLWATGAREETLTFLRAFTAKLANDLGLHLENGDELTAASREIIESGLLPERTRLLARCYYKLGEWQMALQDNYGSDAIPDILQSYLLATNLDRTWYKAWHAWALANSEVVSHYVREQNDQAISERVYTNYLVPAVTGGLPLYLQDS